MSEYELIVIRDRLDKAVMLLEGEELQKAMDLYVTAVSYLEFIQGERLG